MEVLNHLPGCPVWILGQAGLNPGITNSTCDSLVKLLAGFTHRLPFCLSPSVI